MRKNPILSIVVPVYFNELNIPKTLRRLKNLQSLLPKFDLEFVFVDDASGDKSFETLLAARKRDKRIRIVRLSRNFGSMNACLAGLSYCRGDCVGIVAADLQDPPELLGEMVARWQRGKKVVIAVRQGREDSFFGNVFSGFFYRLMDWFAIRGYPQGGFDFVLIDRQVRNELVKIREKNTNLFSLIYWLGYDKDYLYYKRERRTVGKSRWSFAKKVKFFIDSFVAFSFVPIRVISAVGLITAAMSFLYGVIVLVSYLLGEIPIQGYTPIVLVITFFLGLIMIMLGIIGEYLWRILDESRNRPPYVVDRVVG